MFISSSAFEMPLPRPLYSRNERGWKAMTLGVECVWFLWSVQVPVEDGSLSETMAIAWESTLIEVIRSTPREQHGALALVFKSDDRPQCWQLRQIEEIWLSSAAERGQTGLVVFRLEGEGVLRNVFLTSFEPAVGKRLLVYKRAG
jgi:hypothetical protein